MFKKELSINSEIKPLGISVNAKSSFNELKKNSFPIIYDKAWDNFPYKKELIKELIPLLTISLPLTANATKINYNTGKSEFIGDYKNIFLKSLPGANFDYKLDLNKLIEDFNNIEFAFSNNIAVPREKMDFQTEEKAIIPLSCGKDSLLTLAMAREIGLEPLVIYVNDTVVPQENLYKSEMIKKLAESLKLDSSLIINEVEQLNDFEFWDKPETCFCYSHMLTGFCFLSLPLAYQHKAKYILLGNQQDMDFSFSQDNIHYYPSYDQSTETEIRQNEIINKFTNNEIGVYSLIRPLTNISIIKILFERFPEIAKYQFSCDCLTHSKENRWCYSCNKCARLSLLMLANKINPKAAGFEKNLLVKENEKLYSLFQGKEVDIYEKSQEARDQQLLAFYMAYKNNVQGELIDKFKKQFLDEAKEREDELYKKFFRIYPCNLPPQIKNKVLSIYKESLSEFI